MAKRTEKNDKRLNYAAALKALKAQGPGRLYLLWGPEDYLREQFLNELRKACLPEGEDSFSFKRMNGPELDLPALREAVDAIPFMSERSFVELRNVELNRLGDAEGLLRILSDIPETCTLAFVQSAQFEPDGRLKLIKGIRSAGRVLDFCRCILQALNFIQNLLIALCHFCRSSSHFLT